MSRRGPLLVTAAAAAALLTARLRRRLTSRRSVAAQPTEVNLLPPEETVKVHRSGPASSVQEAELLVERTALERIWTPDSLELLARGYWAFMRRVSLGVIRVLYAPDSRTVTILSRIPLLRFATPEYEAADGVGRVTWPVVGGMLVAREGRGQGHLRVQVKRCDRDGVDDEADAQRDEVRLIARVEVENFYPGLRGGGWFSRWGAWFYAQTQLRVHVIFCNAFLRSLPKLDFPDIDTTSMPSDGVAHEPAGTPA